MALQGSVAVKDKPLILAHYMNDTSIKDWTPTKGNTEMYRALIILPIDNIDVANLSISIFIDPSGEVYEQYVSTRFSDCNWVGRESELLVVLGEEEDLDDIHEYLNLEEALEDYRNIDEETKLKEESSRPAKPPKTLPKPKRSSQSRHADDVGHEDQRARQESQQKAQTTTPEAQRIS
ncbi:uncharacterized protein LOC112557286 [Pomacea canaliculata]|nr:uncharacterized protein LOC112557286 [Pomacea canaliculata]